MSDIIDLDGHHVLIYDMEVYQYDWLFTGKYLGQDKYIQIHNDNHKVREVLADDKLLLVGFNSKFYDDGILHAIYHGADNKTIKDLNDFIIEKRRMWWEYPFLQYKKKHFRGFDIKDDLPPDLSLKAIEGNMGKSVMESGVGFDIDRPLTDDELVGEFEYNKADVNVTEDLFMQRLSYVESKLAVAELKNMDKVEAVRLTNAKLTSAFLGAKRVERADEFDYPYPPSLRIEKYTHLLDFYSDPVGYTMKTYEQELDEATTNRRKKTLERRIAKLQDEPIPYNCSLTTDIAGVRHVYGWGGIHGARSKYWGFSDETHNIVLIDVGSYYPSMMLAYDYISRNIPSSEGFADVYRKRMHAKETGDKKTSDALKLVLNTTYGAMKNRYNDLYDPRNANAICIGGQLLLTDLIERLETVKGFELIQSNTDGLIIRYERVNESQVRKIISEWEQRTEMSMEYTDIHVIAQKDVNNYVMRQGEVYEIVDGEKVLLSQDEGRIITVGGWVSRDGGGDFVNNSMTITHDALVNYFMDGIPVEDTINNESDVTRFQIIAKTGSKYRGSVHYVDGKPIEAQNVNRIYATTDTRYGTIKKFRKEKGVLREAKIPSLPDHAYIDNDNKMTIDDIDRTFYIELSKQRIEDFVGKRNLKKYSGKVKPFKKKVKKEVNDMEKMNIFEKVNNIRLDFSTMGIKKTGVNTYAEFKYFTLDDIIPAVLQLNNKYGVMTQVTFTDELATLIVHNIHNPDETMVFSSPMATKALHKGATEVQDLGAVQTYLRRYLYLAYLEVVEADIADLMHGSQTNDDVETLEKTKAKPKATKKKVETPAKKSNRPASPKKRAEAKAEVIGADDDVTPAQVKSIKAGLKKLRDKGDNETYIKDVVTKLRGGLTKVEAEELMIEISKKIKE